MITVSIVMSFFTLQLAMVLQDWFLTEPIEPFTVKVIKAGHYETMECSSTSTSKSVFLLRLCYVMSLLGRVSSQGIPDSRNLTYRKRSFRGRSLIEVAL